jgi:hypothetical protein
MNTQLQTRVNRYYTAEETAKGLDDTNDIETPQRYINSTCNADEEVDDEALNYNPSDDDNEFDDTFKEDQNAADENIE